MTDDSFQKRIEISVTIYIIFILYIIVKQNPPKNQNCHPSSVICTGIKFMPESWELSFLFTTFAHKDTYNMKENKPYSRFEEKDDSCPIAAETAAALPEPEVRVIPDDVDYAHILNGTLQVTPDIEEEITAVDRGETVSMSEFKTMFSRWL